MLLNRDACKTRNVAKLLCHPVIALEDLWVPHRIALEDL
jgi:hypothetical protein